MSVKRLDRGTTTNVRKTPEGWLHLDGRLTRTGVFTYYNPDGSTRRELRLPEEVFHADSLATANLVPLTNTHPDDFLTAATTRQHQVGTVGQDVRRDEQDHLVATIRVTDAAAIAAVEKGRRQLSCGYNCDLEEKPGVWNGERYDVIQRQIRYNHVALVDLGRAGPTARLRMDAAEGDVIHPTGTGSPSPSPQEHKDMTKIRLDGVDYEISEQGKQAVERELARRDAEEGKKDAALATATANAEKEKGRADAAAADAEKARKDAAEAAKPERISALVNARAAIVSTASKVLGKEAKLDAADEQEIQRQVLAKLNPTLKLDGKSADYVRGAYELAVEKLDAGGAKGSGSSGTGNAALDAARKAAAGGSGNTDSGEGAPEDSDAARKKMAASNADAWKQPLGKAGARA